MTKTQLLPKRVTREENTIADWLESLILTIACSLLGIRSRRFLYVFSHALEFLYNEEPYRLFLRELARSPA